MAPPEKIAALLETTIVITTGLPDISMTESVDPLENRGIGGMTTSCQVLTAEDRLMRTEMTEVIDATEVIVEAGVVGAAEVAEDRASIPVIGIGIGAEEEGTRETGVEIQTKVI